MEPQKLSAIAQSGAKECQGNWLTCIGLRSPNNPPCRPGDWRCFRYFHPLICKFSCGVEGVRLLVHGFGEVVRLAVHAVAMWALTPLIVVVLGYPRIPDDSLKVVMGWKEVDDDRSIRV